MIEGSVERLHHNGSPLPAVDLPADDGATELIDPNRQILRRLAVVRMVEMSPAQQ